MFAKRYRLPHSHPLVSPKTIHTPLWIIKYRENTLFFNRFAINVSKRVDKRAVVRNRLRRVLQHCLGEIAFKQEVPVDMLIIVKKPFIALSTKEICATLTSLLQKEGLV